jgi:hypothetical protein
MSGRPLSVVMDYDTGVAKLVLENYIDHLQYVFEAHGGLAISLMRQVRRDTRSIAVVYDQDGKTMLSFILG